MVRTARTLNLQLTTRQLAALLTAAAPHLEAQQPTQRTQRLGQAEHPQHAAPTATEPTASPATRGWAGPRHGEYAGYRWHHNHGIPPCEPCMEAYREYRRNRRRAQLAKTNPETKPATARKAPKHGTYAGYRWHQNYGIPQCEPCLQACRDKSSERRDAQRKTQPQKELAPCGTERAYHRHLRLREPIDDACRTAHNEHHREYQRARRRRLTPRTNAA